MSTTPALPRRVFPGSSAGSFSQAYNTTLLFIKAPREVVGDVAKAKHLVAPIGVNDDHNRGRPALRVREDPVSPAQVTIVLLAVMIMHCPDRELVSARRFADASRL
jgi:hypothetical protein